MLTAADKFWVAVLIAGANVVRTRYNIDFGLDAGMASDLVGGITAAFVWLVPNKKSA